jgi:hypothetical protein
MLLGSVSMATRFLLPFQVGHASPSIATVRRSSSAQGRSPPRLRFGAFEKTGDGGVRVHEAPPPSKDDVDEVARRIRDRALRWLRRHGWLDECAAEERGNEPLEPDALQGCMQLALAGGAFLARPIAPKDNPDAAMERRERRLSASCDGFDVHCAVRIAAGDDQGRERLVRYCARPPFALDRIEGLADGWRTC